MTAILNLLGLLLTFLAAKERESGSLQQTFQVANQCNETDWKPATNQI